jgi:hypothetical protein
MLDEDTLARRLHELGWEAQPHGERTFRLFCDTEEGEVVLYLRLTESWLVLSVVPFLSTSGSASFELSRWLLRMNRDMFQAKFAYDEDGDVVLTIDLPTESLDDGELRAALENLRDYAVTHRATLRRAAKVGQGQ